MTMPSADAILFDMRVNRIRHNAGFIDSIAHAMADSQLQAEEWDLYDLKRSADNLRQAADYLDDIRRRLEPTERENSE